MKTIPALLLGLLVVAAFFQVIARNFLNFTVTGVDELLGLAVLWLGFFGIPVALDIDTVCILPVKF
jgi:TRAP-type C4-dicarboxylate transport system permease small subunit